MSLLCLLLAQLISAHLITLTVGPTNETGHHREGYIYTNFITRSNALGWSYGHSRPKVGVHLTFPTETGKLYVVEGRHSAAPAWGSFSRLSNGAPWQFYGWTDMEAYPYFDTNANASSNHYHAIIPVTNWAAYALTNGTGSNVTVRFNSVYKKAFYRVRAL